jgi:hypothetical protein
LILGGYGVFGGRLADLLSDIAQLDLIICGRNLAQAEDFCRRFNGVARVTPLKLDRRDVAAALQSEKPDLLVDASGPFQDYGGDGYAVIRACIAAGVDYLDFADAADFVFGVRQFDAEAKASNVLVLSGVSSFPVLTAAVLREMAKTMEIVAVDGGIAPSPYAGIGLNVMRAVLGYAGSPITLLRNGQEAQAIALGESRRFTISVPGRLPLRNIRFSLVEVPDLRVIPAEIATLENIWMGAGPVPEFLHRSLNFLALARYRLGLPSLAPLSQLFYFVLNAMRFGEHRGGMFVRAKGRCEGKSVERSWHLLAEGDDGPLIPSMAIEAVVRRILADRRPDAGARAATRELELADYDALFAGRAITTGFRQAMPAAPLYRSILGSAFDKLPDSLQRLHGSSNRRRWSGVAEVRRGTGFLVALVARLFGFPAAREAVSVTVTFSPQPDGGERWIRDFGGQRLTSVQSPGSGKDEYLLSERFGAVRVALALVVENDRLYLVPRRWSLFGVSMPMALVPSGQTFESEIDGYFCFDVEISAPIIGLIVAYRGRLKPVSE